MHWHRHQDHASCPVCRLLCWAHARISSTSPQSMHGPCGAWHTEIIYHGKRLVGYACRVLRSGSEANLSTVRPRDRCCTHARVKRTSSLRATPSNLKPQRRTRRIAPVPTQMWPGQFGRVPVRARFQRKEGNSYQRATKTRGGFRTMHTSTFIFTPPADDVASEASITRVHGGDSAPFRRRCGGPW